VGGCAPFTLTEVSLFEEGRPSPSTGVASLRPYIEPGVEGAQPHPRGLGDVPPETENRGRAAHLSNQATSGAQNAGKP